MFTYIKKEVEREDEKEKEEKRNSSKRKIFLESHVETEISSVDVGAFRNLAHYLQVHTLVGLDDGIPGGEAGHLCAASVGKEVCRIRQLCEGVYRPFIPADDDQYHRDQYLRHCDWNDISDLVCIDIE